MGASKEAILFRGRAAFAKNVRGSMLGWSIFAILLGVLATALFILAIGVYYGYITSAFVGNLTYGELGVLAFVTAAAAVGCEVVAQREKGRRGD